jgi:hypothetical protein
MVTTTPPGALRQSISVKFTKEERKDLLLSSRTVSAQKVKEGLHLRPRVPVLVRS